MIAVIGALGCREPLYGQNALPAGLAAEIAMYAADRTRGVRAGVPESGRKVEMVGSVGLDPAGDAVVVGLGMAHVGRDAMQRDPARRTPVWIVSEDGNAEEVVRPAPDMPPPDLRPILERADVELALRYLPELAVVVVVDGITADGFEAAVDGAAFAGARLIVVTRAGDEAPAIDGAIVLQAPDEDEGAFARFVAGLACLLDARREPEQALAQAARSVGWEPATSGEGVS